VFWTPLLQIFKIKESTFFPRIPFQGENFCVHHFFYDAPFGKSVMSDEFLGHFQNRKVYSFPGVGCSRGPVFVFTIFFFDTLWKKRVDVLVFGHCCS
jgi:hypothetical protein